MQSHALLMRWADTITREEVNAAAASLLSYISHYADSGAAMSAAEADPGAWAPPGPTRATSIVACIPAFTDPSGQSTGAAAEWSAVSFRRWCCCSKLSRAHVCGLAWTDGLSTTVRPCGVLRLVKLLPAFLICTFEFHIGRPLGTHTAKIMQAGVCRWRGAQA